MEYWPGWKWQGKYLSIKNPGSVFTAFKKDGDKMIFGEKAFEVRGFCAYHFAM